MNASASRAGREPPGRYLPAAGWYPDPAGSGVLLWWDGHGRTAPTLWPQPPQVPAPPPGRLVFWLVRPAAAPLLVALAAPTAPGWVTAAWSSSVLVFVWLTVWAFLHGGFSAGVTVRGQQLVAAAWMMHFILWCGIACRRLNRNCAAAGMWWAGHASTRT